MWKFTVLVLSVLTIGSLAWFGRFNLPVLNTPTSLTVGHETHRNVRVYWSFEKPENVPLSEVIFVLTLDSETCYLDRYHVCMVPRIRFRKYPLVFKFTELFPGVHYVLSIVATHPKWRDSSRVRIPFTTREKDWAAPPVTSVTRTDRKDIAEFEVRWDQLSQSQPGYVFIEVCDPGCVNHSRDPTATVALVPAKFESKISIRACAVYYEVLVGLIMRYSDYVYRETGREPPENLLSSKVNIEVENNRIKLPWHPLMPLEGPRSYYEIVVTDPMPESSYSGPDILAKDPGFSLIPSPTMENAIEMRFDKVEDDPAKRSPRVKPVSLKIVSQSIGSVKLRIFFRQNLKDRPDGKSPADFLLLGPSVAKIFGFPIYEPMKFSIRSCLYYPSPSLNTCGNSTKAKIMSNVGVPSPVLNLGFRYRVSKAMEFFWWKPARPRGPIDGYRAIIQRNFRVEDDFTVMQGFATAKDAEARTLHPSTRSFFVKDFVRTGRFDIAAFNIDREDDDRELLSEWRHVVADVPHLDGKVIPIIFLVITVVCASVFGPCCYRICSEYLRILEAQGLEGHEHVGNHVPIAIPNGGLIHPPNPIVLQQGEEIPEQFL